MSMIEERASKEEAIPSDDIDPITLSVVLSRLEMIVKEMTTTLEQTAHTSILALARDFSCAIYDRDARQVAVHDGLPIHTTSMDMVLRGITSAFESDVHDGDVFLCNDPQYGNTHIGDLVTARPVFVAGELVFWAVTRGHQMDTGAFVPSSVSAAPRDVWQEGLTIPPTRLRSKGSLETDVLRLYLANVRYSDSLEGDLMAQAGSIETGSRRLVELCLEHGVEELLRYVDAIIEYGARRMAHAIEAMPDGEYRGEIWLDSDGGNRTDIPVRVAVRISGSEIEVDYTGSAEQGPGGINGSAATARATAVTPFLYYVSPDIPHNDGCMRQIHVVAPEGTICHARYPASTSCATVVPSDAMHDAINKAMVHALPDRVRAGSARAGNIPQLSGVDPATGAPWAAMIFSGGGHGASRGTDGWPLIQTLAAMGAERSVPVEHIELLYPLTVEQMEIEPDSMGAGQWIGGPGIRVILRAPGCDMTSLSFGDGFRNPPHGVLGGTPGIGGGQYVEYSDGRRGFVSACGSIDVPAGAAWVSVATGGGGYGRPIDRDAELVRRNVRDGIVSRARAVEVFGVVLSDDRDLQVDVEATRRRRAELERDVCPLLSPTHPGAATWEQDNARPGDLLSDGRCVAQLNEVST